MPTPISYRVSGEDLHGEYESIHDIQATEDGGFELTETTKYANEKVLSSIATPCGSHWKCFLQSSSFKGQTLEDGTKVQIKKFKQAKTKVDSRGRVVSVRRAPSPPPQNLLSR